VILPKILYTISKKLTNHNAKAILVGGAVRDYFLNLPIKDYDIEIYGLKDIDALENILLEFGAVNIVGKSFGVLKFTFQKDEYDFSFPRLESKISKGHRGFKVICDGELTFKEASRRRDFTINSMGYNILTKEFLDPFNGLEDIKSKIIKITDSRTFTEDPLRVYRAVQFCARFDYKLSTDTFVLCRDMVKSGQLDELAKERVYEEFKKLLLKSENPSIGFLIMRDLGIIELYFEELDILDKDSCRDILLSIDRLAKSKESLTLILSTLLHKLDSKLSKALLYKLTDNHKLISSIITISKEYDTPKRLYLNNATDKDIRELATRVDISQLVRVVDDNNIKDWLLNYAKRLGVSREPLKALISGRDLISLGFQPSVRFKEILDNVYQLQLNGEINSKDEAYKFVKNNENR
jgi:tRNA nucleotidyltransferase (CCA-adding enzyme)